MQSPAGADRPHTHARPVHWIITLATVAAVIAGAALIQPPGAAAGSDHKPLTGPDAGAVHYPLDCAGQDPEVFKEASSDLDHDGRAETVAVVRCRAGSGNPPSGVYVLSGHTARGPGAAIAETLLDPQEGLSVGEFAVRESEISATMHGYSSPDVPRCCPDKQRAVVWHWEDGGFVLEAEPVPGSQV